MTHLFPLTTAVAESLTDAEEESIAMLRNKFSHHYPDGSATRLDRINLVLAESRLVIALFQTVTAYLKRKGLEV